MNFGFRYHVASLLAVLFSLILGVLIGGALSTDHSLVEEQALFIAELEERLREVNGKVLALQAEQDLSARVWAELQESLGKEALKAKTVVLVGEEGSTFGEKLRAWGADVKVVATEVVETVLPQEDLFFVFTLDAQGLAPQALERARLLAEGGASLGFVWESGVEPPLSALPPSLQVDSVDTTVGELAFLVGLIKAGQGRFGLQKDAERLFP